MPRVENAYKNDIHSKGVKGHVFIEFQKRKLKVSCVIQLKSFVLASPLLKLWVSLCFSGSVRCLCPNAKRLISI